MPDSIRCKDIVEVIQSLEPDNVLKNCRDRSGFAVKKASYREMQWPDGSKSIVEWTGKDYYYRGENKAYPLCKPGLYRLESRDDQICSLLKTYDFILFLHTLPNVQAYINQGMHFDPWALAQHYDFATPLIDLTNDIGVAAFFATHYYDRVIKEYQLIKECVGTDPLYKRREYCWKKVSSYWATTLCQAGKTGWVYILDD